MSKNLTNSNNFKDKAEEVFYKIKFPKTIYKTLKKKK